MNLKRHLMGCHGWDKFRASSARLNFGLNKKRAVLSPSKRKSKQRSYTKRQCLIKGCLKEVMRFPNHLQQTHKVKEGSRVKQLMMEYVPIMENMSWMKTQTLMFYWKVLTQMIRMIQYKKCSTKMRLMTTSRCASILEALNLTGLSVAF